MAAYTQSIDLHIARTLELRGFVTPDMLPGIDEAEAREMLRQYAEIHSTAQRLELEGDRLSVIPQPVRIDSDLPESRPNKDVVKWWAGGAVVVLVAAAVLFSAAGQFGVRRSTSWPASPDGHVALFYFGTST